MDQGFEELERFGEDLKKNYLQKIESFVDKSSQSPADESEPLPSQEPATASPSVGPSFGTSRPRNSYSGSSGPSGLSLLFMLILGLALGGGASFYFRDQAQKADQSMRERVAQLETEKRAVEDNMAMYQQTFAEIANGKMKTLPQLDAAMAPIRKAYAEERKQAEKEFLSRKENLMKKVSAGDRLSKLIQKLEQTRNERIESLNVQERSELEPYLKQRQVLNELIANR